MTERPQITDEMVSAWLDGALDPVQQADLEAAMAADPALAARIEGWRARDEAIGALFAPFATGDGTDLPAALQKTRSRPVLPALAAALALAFIAGGAGGYFLRAGTEPPAISESYFAEAGWLADAAREVYLTYVREVRHPVEVGAEEREHLVGWLGNRIERPFTAPQLDALGFALVGGRLLPIGGAPGAMLMYETAQGDRMTILLARNQGARDTAFQFSQGDGVNTLRWVDGPIAYAISGFIDRPDLETVSRAIYRHFEDG